jgi:hypothetical protein
VVWFFDGVPRFGIGVYAAPFVGFDLFFGIRVALACFTRRHSVFLAFALASAIRYRASRVAPVRLLLRWHPRFVTVLHASPLCGAAPTFLCRRKEK